LVKNLHSLPLFSFLKKGRKLAKNKPIAYSSILAIFSIFEKGTKEGYSLTYTLTFRSFLATFSNFQKAAEIGKKALTFRPF
jgi:hypothetical protein